MKSVEKIAVYGTVVTFLTFWGGKDYLAQKFNKLPHKSDVKGRVTTTMPDFYCKGELSKEEKEKEQVAKVFFEETGHNLEGKFLNFWRTHKGDEIIGKPITEPIEEDGKAVQYFENIKLVFNKEGCETGEEITVAKLGTEVFADEKTAPAEKTAEDTKYSRHFAESGHTIKGKLKKFWEKNGGVEIFGLPRSEQFEKDGVIYQLFENVRMGYYPKVEPEFYKKQTAWRDILLLYPGEIKLTPLGKMEADRKGVDTSPVSRVNDVSFYSSELWKKRIEVDKTNQRVKVYEDDTLVMEAKTSTGLWGGLETPSGEFKVQTKLKSIPMSGVGYYLPNVPWNLLFSSSGRGYLIHGAYWHDDFGMRKSHGCVNLEPDDAKRVYDWAKIGTPVIIY